MVKRFLQGACASKESGYISPMKPSEHLVGALRAAPSIASVARSANLPTRTVQSIHDGTIPSLDRASKLCDALGLELYIGPPIARDGPPKWAGELREEVAGVREDVRTILQRFGESGGEEATQRALEDLAAQYDEDADVFDTEEAPGTRRVSVVELAAAAGAGAEILDGEVVGGVWFSKGWLRRRNLDAAQCVMIRVRGESMEPELRDGSWVLVDRQRRRRRKDGIFVVRLPDDGVVVKRAGRGKRGGWTMLSEHPSWEPAPWPRDAVTIGEVVWTARSLI